MTASAHKLFLKLFILFSIFYFLFSIFTESVSAQTINQTTSQTGQANSPSYLTPNTNPDVPQNLHTYTQSVMIEITASLFCQLTGTNLINTNDKCLGIDPQTKKIGYVENEKQNQAGGLLGTLTNFISYTYNIPGSSSEYFRYLSANFGVARPVYAQGAGFISLSPLMEIWKAFRNIVYLFFVLIFVIIGVAIMVRVPLDNRTVMTVQNQIPKIIITLLLITFSYAIAGFMIDLMWLVIYITFSVLSSPSIDLQLAPNFLTSIQGNNPIGYIDSTIGIGGLSGGTAGAFGAILANILDNPVGHVIAAIIGIIAAGGTGAVAGALLGPGALITGIIGALVGGGSVATGIVDSKTVLQTAGQIIAFLIIIIALLSALFRVWISLLKAYVFVLLDVIFAPFWIAIGLIPGSTSGIGSWLRDLAANLSAFPVTAALFFLAKVFIDKFATTQTTDNFVPPLIGNPGPNTAIGFLIGFGTILLAPEALSMARDLFKPPQFKYMASIGQGIGIGQGVVGAGLGGTWGKLWRSNNQGVPTGILNTAIYSGLAGRPWGARVANIFGAITGGWRPGVSSGQALENSFTASGTNPPTTPAAGGTPTGGTTP